MPKRRQRKQPASHELASLKVQINAEIMDDVDDDALKFIHLPEGERKEKKAHSFIRHVGLKLKDLAKRTGEIVVHSSASSDASWKKKAKKHLAEMIDSIDFWGRHIYLLISHAPAI
jgi:hypothetical protein